MWSARSGTWPRSASAPTTTSRAAAPKSSAASTTVDTGDGVVLLTDMFGGTPSNLAISQMDRQGVEVIAGVNLPMLVKLAKVRSNQPLADAVDCAQTAGRKYIAAASHVLPNAPRAKPPVRQRRRMNGCAADAGGACRRHAARRPGRHRPRGGSGG